MIYVDKKSTRITTLSITKTITMHSIDQCVENLEILQKQKFNRIKIPYFTFKVYGTEVIIESEYIKGPYIGEKHYNILYEDLVLKPGPYSFHDYHYTNYKVNKFDDQIYAVDLDDFQTVTFTDRIENWNKNFRKSKLL
tara:strand:- start:4419 stop:4832 length:414 start_codon:yes stop_codon:yes gene_type:complete